LSGAFYRASGKVFAGRKHNTPQRKITVTVLAPSTLALPEAVSETPGKDFLIFFQIFFAECLLRTLPAKIFFSTISLPGALTLTPGKDFIIFLIISLPGVLALAPGNSRQINFLLGGR